MAERKQEDGKLVELNPGMVHISVPVLAVIEKCMDAHLRLVGAKK